MRSRATLAVLVSLVVLLGCEGERRPERTPSPGSEPAAAPVTVTRMPKDPSAWPWLRSRLPRRVPSDLSPLARLVEDPPGRATMVYHPAEHWPEPVEGWASETLAFHGVDGRWRVLTLDELALDDRTWGGHDTYGAGSLSPDGRWWAGRSRTGVILLDLATGAAEVVPTGTRWTAWVRWRGDSRSLLVAHGSRARIEILRLPSRRRTVLPFRGGQVAFDPQGTAVSVRAPRRDEIEVIAWSGSRPVVRGSVHLAGVGRDAASRRLSAPEATERHLLVSVQRRPYRTIDLVVIDRDRLTADRRLHLDRTQRASYRSSRWLDERTVLLEAGPGLLAWRPADGRFRRVTAIPDPGNGFASLDVAVDLVR